MQGLLVIARRGGLPLLLAAALLAACSDSDFDVETVDNLAAVGQLASPFCCRIPDGKPLMRIGAIEIDPLAHLTGSPAEVRDIGFTISDVSAPGVLEFHWDGWFVATGQERPPTPIADLSNPGFDTLFRVDSDVGGFNEPAWLAGETPPYALHVYANSCAFSQASFLITVFEYRIVAADPVTGDPIIELLKVQRRTVTIVNDPSLCPVTSSDIVVFARSDDLGPEEIWTNDLSGDEAQLAGNSLENLDPAWSPDRLSIAFVSNRANPLYYELCTMDADGTDVEVMTAFGDRWVYDPAWAPNGHEIAMAVGLPGQPDTDIWILDLDLALGPTNPRQLTSGIGQDKSPTWSPDGLRIAFVRTPDILVVEADGSPGPATLLEDMSALSVDWSSQDELVFDRYETAFIAYRIWRADSDGQNPARVNDGVVGQSDLSPTWSPDGSRIAFVRGELFAEFPARRLHVMDVDGSDAQPVAIGPGDDTDPDW